MPLTKGGRKIIRSEDSTFDRSKEGRKSPGRAWEIGRAGDQESPPKGLSAHRRVGASQMMVGKFRNPSSSNKKKKERGGEPGRQKSRDDMTEGEEVHGEASGIQDFSKNLSEKKNAGGRDANRDPAGLDRRQRKGGNEG